MADNDIQTDASRGSELKKILLVTVMSTIILCVVTVTTTCIIVDNLMSKKISQIQLNTEEASEEDASDDDAVKKGIIVDLGDFILNLCDENQKKYLKANVAIEVSQKDSDFQEAAPKKESHGGHGESAEPANPMEGIQNEMNQYKPAIRDAVITNLSSKTSAELSSAAGKELAKEQITNDINSILGGEREVLRVSFGQFIIQ